MGQERLGPSYFFISLVLGLLNSLLWYVPSSRYSLWSSAHILFLQEQIKDIIIIIWLRSASEKNLSISFVRPIICTGLKSKQGSCTPSLVCSPLASHSSLVRVGVWMRVWGCTPPQPAGGQQSAARPASCWCSFCSELVDR